MSCVASVFVKHSWCCWLWLTDSPPAFASIGHTCFCGVESMMQFLTLLLGDQKSKLILEIWVKGRMLQSCNKHQNHASFRICFSCVVFGLIFVSSSYVFCHSRFTPGDFFHMMDRAHEESLYPQVSRHRNPVYGAIWGTLKIGGLKNPSYTHEPAWTKCWFADMMRYILSPFLAESRQKWLRHDTLINFMFEVQELDWWWAIWARWRESHDWFPWLRTLYRPILRGVLCYGIGGRISDHGSLSKMEQYVATKFGVVFWVVSMYDGQQSSYLDDLCVCVFFFIIFVFSVFLLHQHVFNTFMIDLNPGNFQTGKLRQVKPKPFCSQAVKMVRGEMGLKNVEIMIPFVRTLDMAKDVNEVLESWLTKGLKWLVVSSSFYFHCYLLPGNMIQFD